MFGPMKNVLAFFPRFSGSWRAWASCVCMGSVIGGGTGCTPDEGSTLWCVRPMFLDGTVPASGMVEVLLAGEAGGSWGGGAAWESLGSWPAESWRGDGVLGVPVPAGREVAALRWEVQHPTWGWGETYEVRRPASGWGAVCFLPTPVGCRVGARRAAPAGGDQWGWALVPWAGEPSASLGEAMEAGTVTEFPWEPERWDENGQPLAGEAAELTWWVLPDEFPGFRRTWAVFAKFRDGTWAFHDTLVVEHAGGGFPMGLAYNIP